MSRGAAPARVEAIRLRRLVLVVPSLHTSWVKFVENCMVQPISDPLIEKLTPLNVQAFTQLLKKRTNPAY